MDNRKESNFFLGLIAVIVGARLFRGFDFETFKYNKPALGIIYLVVFVCVIYFLVTGNRKSKKEQ